MIYESLIKEKFYKILNQMKSENLHVLQQSYFSLIEDTFIKKDYKKLRKLLSHYFVSDKHKNVKLKLDINEFLEEIHHLDKKEYKKLSLQKIQKEETTSFISYLEKEESFEDSYEKLFKMFFKNLNHFLISFNKQNDNSFLKESINNEDFSFNKNAFNDLNIGKDQAQQEILKYQKADSQKINDPNKAKDIKEEFLEDIRNINDNYVFQNLKENLKEVSSREDRKKKKEEEIHKYEKNLKEKEEKEKKNDEINLKSSKDSPFYFSKLPKEIKKGRLKDKINLTYDLKYIFNSLPYRKYRKLLNEALKHINANNLHEALEYYYVIYDQKLPHTIKLMIKKNISDIESTLTRATVRKKIFFS